MTRIGYTHFDPDAQDQDISRLKAEVHEIVGSEVGAGPMRAKQIELDTLIQRLHAGDELVVLKLDHIARSAREALRLIDELALRGASLRVLEPEVATSGEMGKTVATVLSMIASLEFKAIKDRQRAGIEAGRAAGSYKGRLKSVDDDEIRRRVAAGESKAAIARAMNISRMTIYRAIGAPDGGTSDIDEMATTEGMGSTGEDGN